MPFKILFVIAGVAILALAGMWGYVIMRHYGPPTNGAMAEFKPVSSPVPVPVGTFVDADGKPLDLSKFKGKMTLVNFWATWCAPCVRELPSLDRLKRARENDDFQVETISEDRGGKIAIVDFFKRAGIISLPQYSDTEAVYGRLLNFQSLPTTILLDAEGRELGRYDAGEVAWDEPDAGRIIDYYLAKAKQQ